MALAETMTLPAPKGDLQPAQSKWQREDDAFRRLLPDLLRTHGGQYVVIHEGRMVDSGPDELALAVRFLEQHGNVPIHVGLVTDQPERIARVPHYRQPCPTGPLG